MSKAFIFPAILLAAFSVYAQVNRPPNTPVIYGPAQWFVNSTTTFSAVSTDPDSATTSELVSSQVKYSWDWEGDGAINAVSGFLSFGQAHDLQRSFSQTGNYTIKVMAEDALGATSTWASFRVSIITVNKSPELEAIGAKTVSEGQELSFSVFGSDPDGDTVLYSSSILPKGASFNKAAGIARGYLFKWTPDFEQAGSYLVTFLIEDGRGGSDSEIIVITVNNVDIEAKKDTTSPIILDFSALPTTNSALIKWSADENAVGKVEYGTSDKLGNSSTFTSEYKRNDEIAISGLKPGTLYLYKVTVKDAAGNEQATGTQTFVATSLEVSAAGVRRGKIDAGAPVRVKGEQEVYQLIQGKLRHIPSPKAFSGLGFKWVEIIEVEKSEIANPRLKLIRVAGDPKVYYITESGMKKWIRNIDIFNSYGNKWEDVAVVPQKDLDIYPDVDLIKLNGDDNVYKLEGNTKRWIKDEETFKKLGYDWSTVHPVNQIEFEFYREGEAI